MIRAVLDTNIFVTYLLSRRGPVASIVDAYHDELFTLCTSRELIDELVEVLQRPKFSSKWSNDQVVGFVSALVEVAEIAAPPLPLIVRGSRDQDDNIVLATATATKADVIVTGDQDLLVLKPKYENIMILTAREFEELLLPDLRE